MKSRTLLNPEKVAIATVYRTGESLSVVVEGEPDQEVAEALRIASQAFRAKAPRLAPKGADDADL